MARARIALAVAGGLLVVVAPASAARSPVSSVRTPGGIVTRRAKVAVQARARGKVKLLTVLLSLDRKRSRSDRRVGTLKVRRHRARGKVRVPAGVTGPWNLLACAGRRCRAAKNPIV